LALQGQRRQPGLRLADQVDRQKAGGQRQLGALEQRAGDRRCLMSTGQALEDLAGTSSSAVNSISH
jgi:hypothetical protein